MSVTIVTTPPKTGLATSTDDSSNKLADSNNATDGLDFASLLLGQLAPLTQETLASANTTVQEQTAEDTTAPSDAVAVLASLNLTTQAPEQSISKDAHETISAPLSGEGKNATVLPALATPQTTSTSVANGKQGDAAVVEPGLVETPAVDDKPARFAVPVLAETVKESVAPKALTLDAQPSTISPLTYKCTIRTNPDQRAELGYGFRAENHVVGEQRQAGGPTHPQSSANGTDRYLIDHRKR